MSTSYREGCLLLLLRIAAVWVQGLQAQSIFTMSEIQIQNRNTFENLFSFSPSKAIVCMSFDGYHKYTEARGSLA